jgi:hypothetical protein
MSKAALGRQIPSALMAFWQPRRIAFASCTYIDDGFCDQLCGRIVIIAELEATRAAS